MKYIIKWCESKTLSTGKKVLKSTLTDENGMDFEDVTIWDNFPKFSEIMTGFEVEGDIVTKVNGSYTNRSLYPKKEETHQGGAFKPKSGAITKAIEQKAQNIAHAQENKELGIMTSSTIRMAVDISLAECHGMPFDIGVFKERVKHWRKWLLSEWDSLDAPPFN